VSLVLAISALAAVGLPVPLARGQIAGREGAPAPGQGRGHGQDVRSVFFIAKSENANQVHYGVRLDEACAPVAPSPVFAYWRMLERGPLATEPLLSREIRAYGFAEQRVVARDEHGGRARVTLNALPSRPIFIDSSGSAGSCVAGATTSIDGVQAALTSVFAQLRWPFGVDYLMLRGHALAGGRALQEKLDD